MIYHDYPGADALGRRDKNVVENSEGPAAYSTKGLQRTGVSCFANGGHAPRLNIFGAPCLEVSGARVSDGIHDLLTVSIDQMISISSELGML